MVCVNSQTETALLFDAVQMFATAAFNFDGGNNRIDIKKLSCEMKNGWDSGPSLFNYMKMVSSF